MLLVDDIIWGLYFCWSILLMSWKPLTRLGTGGCWMCAASVALIVMRLRCHSVVIWSISQLQLRMTENIHQTRHTLTKRCPHMATTQHAQAHWPVISEAKLKVQLRFNRCWWHQNICKRLSWRLGQLELPDALFILLVYIHLPLCHQCHLAPSHW